jgi:hypothetical protein
MQTQKSISNLKTSNIDEQEIQGKQANEFNGDFALNLAMSHMTL